MFGRAETRMREYIHAVIETLGTDAKGKPVKLVGNLATFALRAKPSSVLVKDEAAIPSKFKRVTVTLPFDVWERMVNGYWPFGGDDDPDWGPIRDAVGTGKLSVDKAAVKKAFDAGAEVPGCDLSLGGHSLIVT